MYINSNPILIADSREPKSLSDWINYQNSLTDKLLSSKGTIDLELLSQKWIIPTWWDNYLLEINNRSMLMDISLNRELLEETLLYQREILMKSQDITYWYARSVIPRNCYDLDPIFFSRLNSESIRNLIFGNDDVHRVNMTCYSIDKQCIEYYWVKKYISTIQGILWVRFAEFSFRQKASFYLMEILLPELENLK